MKKLVLILVCTALLTFFIAFDYLLWDREKNTQSIQNLEDSIDSKDATIGALGREIKNLEDYNNQLSNKLKLMEEEKKAQEDKISLLEDSVLELQSQMEQKDKFISTLERFADFSPLESIILDWIAKINEGQYQEAYQLMKLKTNAGDKPLSPDEFAGTWMNSVKTMELASLELSPDKARQEKGADILMLAGVNVVVPEEGRGSKLKEGLNKMYFGVSYDQEKKNWFISVVDVAPLN